MLIDVHGRAVTSQKRVVRFTDKALCSFAAVADDAFRALGGLTVVCQSCGETPRMSNSERDAEWKVECACTIRTLVNPEMRTH